MNRLEIICLILMLRECQELRYGATGPGEWPAASCLPLPGRPIAIAGQAARARADA